MRGSFRDRFSRREADWWIAGLLVLSGAILAGILIRLDEALKLDPHHSRLWLYGGDASGASGVLSAIASSSITVAGIVFSANFVAMQLASSLYTPRVIWSLTRRRWLQVVLGSFLATFIYSLLVLRSVRNTTDANPEFVPVVATSMAVILALASVSVFIFYIHRSSQMVQPSMVIEIAASEAVQLMNHTAPLVEFRDARAIDERSMPSGPGGAVQARRSGYIQRLGGSEPLSGFESEQLSIRLNRAVGDFVLEGETLATVYPREAMTPELASAIRSVFELGGERTPDQDVEYGFRRVADISLKALSPAINDPTTAITCIDSLSNLLLRLANHPMGIHPPGSDSWRASIGEISVYWEAPYFERCLDVAFGQLRHYGARDAIVMAHLIDMLGRMSLVVPEWCRGPLRAEADRALTAAHHVLTLQADRDRVDRAATWMT